MDDRLLSTRETAEMLGVSMPWLEQRGRVNGPRFVRVAPRAIRYRLSDIQAWIEANTYQTTEEMYLDGQRPIRRRGRGRPKKAVQPSEAVK